MTSFQIEQILLDRSSERDWIAQTVLKRLSGVPVERIEDKKPLIKRFLASPDPIRAGKKVLLITRFYGRRLKPCPGTSHHICCGYHVINTLSNCPMDCSYCILQGYLNNPFLTLYSNLDSLLEEIDEFLAIRPESLLRLGTGELSDSLALDSLLPVSEVLIPFFAQKRNGVLELKTKSSGVDHLLALDHRGKTVVSWSLNTYRTVEEEERGTASLGERIAAARRCQQMGYPVGFHFDPLIDEPDWEEGYRKTVHGLFRKVDPRGVTWVSLGGFRYPPQIKAISTERFPSTKIFLGELFPGRDGKFRYLRSIRVAMYRKMVGWLREIDPDLFVYLCMESKEVWEEVFGWAPANHVHLNHLFEERLRGFLNK